MAKAGIVLAVEEHDGGADSAGVAEGPDTLLASTGPFGDALNVVEAYELASGNRLRTVATRLAFPRIGSRRSTRPRSQGDGAAGA